MSEALLLGLLGVFGTLAAGLGAQWMSQRAQREQRNHDERMQRWRWEQDRNHQFAQQRTLAYLHFGEAVTALNAFTADYEVPNMELAEKVVQAYQRIEIIGSESVTAPAQRLKDASLLITTTSAGSNERREWLRALGVAYGEYIKAVRAETIPKK